MNREGSNCLDKLLDVILDNKHIWDKAQPRRDAGIEAATFVVFLFLSFIGRGYFERRRRTSEA
jgi:uncharacterized membrane protein YGL010W